MCIDRYHKRGFPQYITLQERPIITAEYRMDGPARLVHVLYHSNSFCHLTSCLVKTSIISTQDSSLKSFSGAASPSCASSGFPSLTTMVGVSGP